MDQNNYYRDMDSYRSQPGGRKNKNGGGNFLGGLLSGMLIALILVTVILFLAMKMGVLTSGRGQNSISQIVGEAERSPSGGDTSISYKDVETKLEGLIELIREEFFLEGADDATMEAGIYKGLMNSLGDPYTEYYTAEEFEELMNQSSGIYYGIGAYIGIDDDTTLPKITGVFKNSPAEQAGLRANDLIYMVDGEQTYGKSLTEVVNLIKGEEGTQVKLTIVRDGEQLEKAPSRAKVEAPTVESRMLDDQMGYLILTEFDDVSTGQFIDAMEELNQSGMKGLILDLRGNPGGNLSTVVEIAQQMLPEGIVVYTEDKEQNRRVYRCKGDKELQIPLVVLVDMNSASASEILAGAIQDYGIGTLVGTTTFGKGIVQSVIPLKDGSAVKITTSGYFTPNGRSIHKIGIEPDIVCEFDGSLYYNVENPVDTQLEKAKEVLAEKIKEKK